jgi:tetratricopeptide (TPR) repeat protein
MAMRIGAGLGNMREAWWVPIIDVPMSDGTVAGWQVNGERSRPHSIMVNKKGRRFVDEAANYNALGAAFHVLDVTEFDYINHPAWLVFDDHYLRRYGLAGFKAGQGSDDALELDPACAQALYGRASLAMNAKRSEEALGFFNRAVEADRRLPEPRRYRALLLARMGRFEGALQDINWCLEREPTSGPAYYTAACVAALAAQRGDSQAGDQALKLLKQALYLGVENRKPAEDEDLAGIRDLPQFKRLVGKP